MFSSRHRHLFAYKYLWLFLFLLFVKPAFQQETKFEFIDCSNLSSDSILQISQTYLERSMPDNALPLLYGLLDTVELESDVSHLAKILLTEGYREKQEFEKGYAVIRNVLQKENLSARNRAYAYNRIAALYAGNGIFGLGRLASTIKYSNLSIEVSKENNFVNLLASSQNELGYVYMLMKDSLKAKKYYLDAYKNYTLKKNYISAANVAINLSNIYLKLNNSNKALSIIDSSISRLKEEDYRNMFMRLYLQKASIYEKAKQYDSAYKYLSRGRIAQKHFFLDRMDKRIFEMAAKYDLQLQRNLLKEEELKKINLQRDRELWIFLSSFLLVVSIFVISIYFLKKKNVEQRNALINAENKHLRFSLDHKSTELSSAMAFSVSQNNTLLEIKKVLQEKDEESAIQLLNSHIDTELKWSKFLANFEESHPDFIPKLIQAYPVLTKGEVELSVLLYTGLKTKEIAKIFNVSDAAISKKRQRLRKKIKINESDSFTDYFRSL